MSKTIPLSRGFTTEVSDADFARVNQFSWSCDRNGYAVRNMRLGPKRYRKVMLHRFIMGFPRGFDVDHIDGDRLNNQRSNLRTATRSQNSANRGSTGGTSRFKGVRFCKDKGRFRAEIWVDGRNIHLGYFDVETEAAKAYNEAAVTHYGEFAFQNSCRASG